MVNCVWLMIKFLNGSWRNDLASVASIAEQSVLIAAPFIKYQEAAWLCERFRPGISVTTLTNINLEAISSSVLDVAALRCILEVSPLARLIALPTLHAKVFVADDKVAIVTSGNLTRSALDHNIEYGILLRQTDLVKTIHDDMISFARLGSAVSTSTIGQIEPLEHELREARSKLDDKASPQARRKLTDLIRKSLPMFVGAHVGNRSKYAVFGEAIRFVLANRPLPTRTIHEQVRSLLPDLCDDSVPLIVNGQYYGKAWKRDLRHAQLHLKRKGVLTLDKSSGLWSLV